MWNAQNSQIIKDKIPAFGRLWAGLLSSINSNPIYGVETDKQSTSFSRNNYLG